MPTTSKLPSAWFSWYLWLCAVNILSALASGCGPYPGDNLSYLNTPSTQSVNTASTTASVPIAPSQGLWVANGTNVLEFYPYAGGSATAPVLTLNSNAFTAPQGVVFDSAGDLWVIDGGTAEGTPVPAALFKFTAAQLRAALTAPSQMPNVTLRSEAFMFPQQAVFDKAGDLWVSDNGANAVFALTPAQLALSCNKLVPKAALMSNPAFNGPLGLAFDSHDQLWVANNADTTIYAFTAAQLPGLAIAGNVTAAPTVILSDHSGTIRAPWGLAFDAGGSLWWSNSDPNSAYTVVAYAPANLVKSGSPMASVTISPTTDHGETTLSAPNGIAFDTQGNLGVVSANAPNGIAVYSAAQTTKSASTVPSVFIPGTASTVDMAAGCFYGPWVH